eukprot:UN27967
MFDRASKKLGLNAAIMSGFETKDGLPVGTTSKDQMSVMDKMLRFGAYGVFQDDDSAATKFVESNIDDILEHNSHKINTSTEGTRKLGGINFSRTNFESKEADSGLDINDADFWDKILKIRSNNDEDEKKAGETEALSLLEDLDGVNDDDEAEEFWERLTEFLNKCSALHRDGKDIPYINSITDLSVRFCQF